MGTKGIGETELGFPHGGNRWSGARPHVPPRCAITLCPLLLCFTHEGESGVLWGENSMGQPPTSTPIKADTPQTPSIHHPPRAAAILCMELAPN